MSKKTLLYIITAIVSLLFIIGSFIESVSFDNKCIFLNWENWKNVLLSLGTGLLSSVVLSFFIDLIESGKNKKTFLGFIAPIRSSILMLYCNCIRLLGENLPDIETNYNGSLLEITKKLESEYDKLNTYVAPVSTSNMGTATSESVEIEKKQKNTKNAIERDRYFCDCKNKFEILKEYFESNKLMLIEKYISEREYCEIVALLNCFTAVPNFVNLKIAFYNNVKDIIRLFENGSVLETLDLKGEFTYTHPFLNKVENKKVKKDEKHGK